MDALLEQVRRHAAARGDAAAVYDERASLTYGMFDAATDLAASRLREAGLGLGDTIAYLGGIGTGRTVSYAAAVKAGVTFMMLDERNPPAVNQDLVNHAGAAAVLAESERYAALGAGLAETVLLLPPLTDAAALGRGAVPRFDAPEVPRDAVAHIRYTSGSSGRPKGIPVSRHSEENYIKLLVEQWAVTADDKLAVFGPFWPPQVGGTLYAGGTIAAYDFAVRGPGGVWQWMRDQRITFASTYTAIFRALPVEGEAKLPDLRLFRLMGEPLYRADAERFEQIAVPGTVFANGYGSNEFAFIAAYNHRVGDPIRFDAMPMGPLTKPEWVSLAGADGMPVPQGEIGEIVVHCPFGPTRYLNDPERTAEVFRPFPAAGGATAYFTGDQGYLDRQGILHPVGRVDEQTKIRGYTVRPSDVETSLRRISGIAQAAVVPHEGPNGIRRLVCHYVLAENASLTGGEIKAALREVLPGYMVPSDYIRHEALPVTSSGKVLRRALPGPDSVRGGNGGGQTAPGSETEQQVADIWREVLGHGNFGVDADFFDVGGDSLQAMSLIVGIEARFGVRIPLETLILKAATVRELAAMIETGGSSLQPMTPLNRGGPLPALSAVPVIGGHLSDYLALAHVLDGAHPVRGLSFAEVQDLAEAGSVAGLAGHSIERLLDEAQGEPIHLLGYSFGGIVAFEMARQLQERNIPAASLIMIDADAPWAEPIPWLRSVWRAAARGDLGASSRRLQELVSAQLDRPSTARTLDEAHFVAMHRYRQAPVHLARALLIVSEERHNADTTMHAWREMLGGGLEIRRAQGNHYAMMRTPHVEALGHQIKAWLAQAAGSA